MIAQDILSNIISFQESLACTKSILFQDYKGSAYRKSIYPEYKGNRKKEGKFYDALKEFFKKLPTITKILNVHFPLIKFQGIEADDTIFYLTQQLEKTVILSTDKDLLQCGVPQFSYLKGDFITLEKEGFENAEEFILCKAIAGDSGDNIKGLERVGMKTAKKYIDKYEATSYADLLSRIPKSTKSKIEQRILDGQEVYELNTRLVDIGLVQDLVLLESVKKDILETLEYYYE